MGGMLQGAKDQDDSATARGFSRDKTHNTPHIL